jgi:glutathione S-transferase
MPHYTSLITLAAVLVYFYTGIRVAQARARTGVKAPATTGNPEFERSFRVQMNTLEWMPIMLPSMWLFAFYVEDGWAAALGGVWIMGRALYIRGYSEAAEKRGTGFSIQALAAGVLWVGALIGVVLNLMKIH